MNPTPEQVAQWAREAGCTALSDSKGWFVASPVELHCLVIRAMKEQADADAKLCDAQHDRARTSPGALRADACAAAIRANAPKGTI